MNGTEWTEPGQGVDTDSLMNAIGDKWRYVGGQLSPALIRLYNLEGTPRRLRRTNLRLTGAPLTAEDVKRIAEAK